MRNRRSLKTVVTHTVAEVLERRAFLSRPAFGFVLDKPVSFPSAYMSEGSSTLKSGRESSLQIVNLNGTDGDEILPYLRRDAATGRYLYGPASAMPADGNYEFGIAADAFSPALAADESVVDFFVNGDLNHDRVVDFDDLLRLAQNCSTTTNGRSFSLGDTNGDGYTNFDDQLLIAQRYNRRLSAPPAYEGNVTVDSLPVQPDGTTPLVTNWAKISDPTITGYSVYRSPDGVSFEKVGEVARVTGTSEPGVYSYTDTTPVDGTKYWYRIRPFYDVAMPNGTVGHQHMPTTNKAWRVSALPGASNVSVMADDTTLLVKWTDNSSTETRWQLTVRNAAGDIVRQVDVPASQASLERTSQPQSQASWFINGLTSATTYTVSVQPFNDDAVIDGPTATSAPTQTEPAATQSPPSGWATLMYDTNWSHMEPAVDYTLTPDPSETGVPLTETDTLQIQFHDLPKHTHLNLQIQLWVYGNNNEFLDFDVTAGGLSVVTASHDSANDYTGITVDTQEHVGSSFTVTLRPSGGGEDVYWGVWRYNWFSVYFPTANIEPIDNSDFSEESPFPKQRSFNVVRDGDEATWDKPLTVELDRSQSTADEGDDYTSIPSSVTIPAGQRSITVTFDAKDDDQQDGPKGEAGFSELLLLTLKPSDTYVRYPGGELRMNFIDDSKWYYSNWELRSKPTPLRNSQVVSTYYTQTDRPGHEIPGVTRRRDYTLTKIETWKPLYGSIQSSPAWGENAVQTLYYEEQEGVEIQWGLNFEVVTEGVTITSSTTTGHSHTFTAPAGEDEMALVVPFQLHVEYIETVEVSVWREFAPGSGNWQYEHRGTSTVAEFDRGMFQTGALSHKRKWIDPENGGAGQMRENPPMFDQTDEFWNDLFGIPNP